MDCSLSYDYDKWQFPWFMRNICFFAWVELWGYSMILSARILSHRMQQPVGLAALTRVAYFLLRFEFKRFQCSFPIPPVVG